MKSMHAHAVKVVIITPKFHQHPRADRIQASLSADICVFCTTRIQFASTRPPKRFQKRLFGSTAIARRPPGAAAARRIDDEEDQAPQEGWRGSSQYSSIWNDSSVKRPEPRGSAQGFQGIRKTGSEGKTSSSRSPFRPLGEEDSRPRNVYRSEMSNESLRRPSQGYNHRSFVPDQRGSHRSSPQGSSRGRGIYQPDWLCRGCRSSNFARSEYCRRCELPKPYIAEWQCGECNTTNDGDRRVCKNCEPTARAKTHDARSTSSWHYLRRASPVQPMPAPSPSPGNSREDEELFAQAREAEPQRARRWNNAGSGQYVGFNQASSSGTRPGSTNFSPHKAQLDNRPPRDRRFPPSAVPSESRLAQGPSFGRGPSGEAGLATDPGAGDPNMGVDSSISFDPSFLELNQRPRKPKRLVDRFENRAAPHDRTRHKARKGGFLRGHETYDEDDDDQMISKKERKEQRKKAQEARKQAAPPTPVYLPEFISVSNLAGLLKVRVEDFLKKMQELGFDDLQNDHVLDAETAGLIAAEFNFEAIVENQEDQDLNPRPPAEDRSTLPARPPVVTIMGHVDHGKTTLLDYLRKSSVAASEHGGITQHIGAFSVPMPGGRLVTFLDTPGHAAFLAMRQRGANVTDIVILVVAADDSVKPQTIEAIKHAQSAKVPMIVAINKIDKEDSNIDRVKQDLARYGVEIEDYGGETQVVCVSGKTGQGLDELEDAAVALADIIDMRAETDGPAEGWVLEATTKKAGRVATVLVRRGTLRPGDVIVAGTSWARVRGLRNEAGITVPHAGPGTPVEVDGWRDQPSAGDEMLQASDEQKAKSVIEFRMEALDRTQMAADIAAVNESRRTEQEKRELEKAKELAAAAQAEGSNDVADGSGEGGQKKRKPEAPSYQEVFFILKADVSGSLEAVTNAVSALGNSEVRPHILRSGVGAITEFDIEHAAVARGNIISFNTHVDGSTRRQAEEKGVRIVDQSIIYRLVDEVKAVLGEKLPSVTTQKVIGEAEVAQVFEINVKGRVTVPVAGCRVRNGVVGKGAKVRVVRDKEVVYDGQFLSFFPFFLCCFSCFFIVGSAFVVVDADCLFCVE